MVKGIELLLFSLVRRDKELSLNVFVKVVSDIELSLGLLVLW